MSSVGQFINQYSLIWLYLLTLALTAAFLYNRGAWRRWRLSWAWGLLATVVLIFALRTPQATLSEFPPKSSSTQLDSSNALNPSLSTPIQSTFSFETQAEIEAAVASNDGRPTLVEFYSDFGIGWAIVIPAVSRIEEEWATGRVLRLNVASETVKMYADDLEIKRTPTFILFDQNGGEMKRWVGEAPKLTDLPR